MANFYAGSGRRSRRGKRIAVNQPKWKECTDDCGSDEI